MAQGSAPATAGVRRSSNNSAAIEARNYRFTGWAKLTHYGGPNVRLWRNKISGLRPDDRMHEDAERASAIVVEGHCPICRVELIRHEDKACCPCGGCSYRVDGDSLWMGSCAEHSVKHCEHWDVIWRLRER